MKKLLLSTIILCSISVSANAQYPNEKVCETLKNAAVEAYQSANGNYKDLAKNFSPIFMAFSGMGCDPRQLHDALAK